MKLERMYITGKEASHAYHIPYSTIAEWRYNGIGPRYIKLGTKVMYAIKALNEFMGQNMVRTQERMPSF